MAVDMKTVAFLQNMWVKNPYHVKRRIELYGENYRRRVLKYSLFAGCPTGRRIKQAFGEELVKQIIWEETTREIAGDPRTTFPPDLMHMSNVLMDENPAIVITFGEIARTAMLVAARLVAQDRPRFHIVKLPHPAARQKDVGLRLACGARTVSRLMRLPVMEVPV
jgi:hypothetical protein